MNDEIIDSLLSKKRVFLGGDFTDRLFAKIEKENAINGVIDDMLRARPAKTSGDFTNRFFAKIKRASAAAFFYRAASFAAVAAAAVFGFSMFFSAPKNADVLDAMAVQMAGLESDMAEMQSYNSVYESVFESFWDYDLNLYAAQ